MTGPQRILMVNLPLQATLFRRLNSHAHSQKLAIRLAMYTPQIGRSALKQQAPISSPTTIILALCGPLSETFTPGKRLSRH